MSDSSRQSPLWPADNPATIAHLNMLQGIITRLASNSVSCKTWCLTLVAAFLSLAGAVHAPQMVTAALLPVIIFGILDVMYLATEKSYRDLYGSVIVAIRQGNYGLYSAFDARAAWDAGSLIWALGSWSVLPYYLLIGFYIVAIASGWPQMLAK